MIVLGIETSYSVASVALMDETKLIGEIVVDSSRTHAEKIMVIIDQLLINSNIKVKDIDLIAVSNGPGSFTGLRIGLSVAKGLAHPFNIPMLEVSTLKAMAYNVPNAKSIICPIFDARRDQVYTCAVQWQNGDLKICIDDENCLLDELIDKLKEYDENIIFLGDAVIKFSDRLIKALGDRVIIATQNIRMPKASSITQLAFDVDRSEYKKYDEIKANYLRKTEAERLYEEKNRS